MFLQACVRNSVERDRASMARGCAWQGACVAAGMCGGGHMLQGGVHGGGHAWQGACIAGACIAGGHALQGGVCGRRACVAGTHAWHT